MQEAIKNSMILAHNKSNNSKTKYDLCINQRFAHLGQLKRIKNFPFAHVHSLRENRPKFGFLAFVLSKRAIAIAIIFLTGFYPDINYERARSSIQSIKNM